MDKDWNRDKSRNGVEGVREGKFRYVQCSFLSGSMAAVVRTAVRNVGVVLVKHGPLTTYTHNRQRESQGLWWRVEIQTASHGPLYSILKFPHSASIPVVCFTAFLFSCYLAC